MMIMYNYIAIHTEYLHALLPNSALLCDHRMLYSMSNNEDARNNQESIHHPTQLAAPAPTLPRHLPTARPYTPEYSESDNQSSRVRSVLGVWDR